MAFTRDQLAGVVAASPFAIHAIGVDARVIAWNQAAERLYGWPVDEVIGRPLPFIAPEDRAQFEGLRARVFGGEVVPLTALTRVRKDGSRITVDLTIVPMRDEQGAVVGAVGFSDDLHARTRAIADQVHQLRGILDAIPAPIFYKDAAGVYRGCNVAFEAYLGKSRDEIVGKDVYGLSPKDLADVYKRADDALYAARGVQIYEAVVRYADGTRHDVMFHKATFADADGQLAGLVGTILDITTRKQAEQALRDSERDLATTLDSIGDGVISTDAAGAVVRMNPVAERLTGWTLADARGRRLAEVFAPADGQLRARDGTGRLIAASAAPIRDGAGQVGGEVTVFRDITDDVRAREAQRAMRERLALADRMSSVGTLAGGVAHEINNPLSYVIGNLTLLDEELRRGAAPDARQLVSEALDGGERIRRIVRDLKTFARADDEVRGPISVPRVLALAIGVASNEIRHRARLVRDVRDVPMVDGNEARLGQVFVNLLINAAQAIPEGDADHHEIKVACRADGARVIVEVHDTGSGIAESVRAHIFEPFFTTKPIGTGTGLGLAACHGIVTAMGGDIEVDSELGRGSVFRVGLPASTAAAARGRATEPPVSSSVAAAAARRGRILIVDDEPIVTRTLRRFLERAHDVTIAASGREALAAIAHGGAAFDVILCDLMMPDMTGMDVHAALVERDPANAERMIFMTGGAFTARARDFLDRVTNQWLEKPFTIPVLDALIRARLG